jgi:AAA domain-containing protein
MAGFEKPKPLKAALKMALFGGAGSGKTFTALLVSEGLAQHTGKRVAYIDTEFGTAFYGQTVPQRKVHPERFDFDVLHTKSITEVLAAIKQLDLERHGVLVVDSIIHLWDSCKNAYTGRMTRAGSVPLPAWSVIKRPYKELMNWILSSPVHVLICGRQGNDFAEDQESGELKNLGYKMRAEGETAYEPDLLLRLEAHKADRKKPAVVMANVEKDRTGILAGQSIPWPTFDNVAQPLLGLLGTTQVAVPSDDEVGQQDAEALARQETERVERSAELAAQFTAGFGLATGVADLERMAKELTPKVKGELQAKDLAFVRKAYATRLGQLKAENAATHGGSGQAAGAVPNGAA